MSANCRHVTETGPLSSYSKLKFKPLQPGDSIRTTTLNTCPLCSIWTKWGTYTRGVVSGEIPPISQDGESPAKLCKLEKPPGDSIDLTTFKVAMDGKQYGEAYHVLICCLLARQTNLADFKVYKVVNANAGNPEILRLLKWYKVAEEGAPNLLTTGKHEATHIIAAAFRAAGPNNQEDVFTYIRESLDHFGPRKSGVIHSKYFTPSYVAKYWLNRYLRLTAQTSRNKKFLKLPKKDAVQRLAVIHLRRNPATPIGRIMDDENLLECIRAIIAANKLCTTLASKDFQAAPFSHIILYGDFSYAKGVELVDLCEQKFGKKDLPELYFISRPWYVKGDETWETSKRDLESKHKAVFELWTSFRNEELDGLPVQVKILGIFAALANRYGEKVCLIGHRSGFVESAGLIGIPIFYLNDEQIDLPLANKSQPEDEGNKQKRQPQPGKYSWEEGDTLWNSNALTKPWGDRLRECSDVMNTFIPVEGLEPPPADSKRLGNSKDPKNSKDSKDSKSSKIPEDQGILHLCTTGKLHLLCLLYMYVNCESEDNIPLWKRRIQVMRDEGGRQMLKLRFEYVNARAGSLKYI